MTTLHDVIGEDPKAMFPHHIDVRHFTTVVETRASLIGCATIFEGVLEKEGVYVSIWASHYKQKIDEELLKALLAS